MFTMKADPTVNTIALRTLFVEQLSILYQAKINLTNCIPKLVDQATFINLKFALTEDLEDTKRQMASLKTIFSMMQEPCHTNCFLGMNAVIDEAYRRIIFHGKSFESDMSILFYMGVVESLQISASKMLNLMALKLAYQPCAQLIKESLDMAEENASLFHCVAEEYLQFDNIG
jgi:ferritin-like metal-binding protein YciE